MTPHLTIGTPCMRTQNLPAISATLAPAADLFALYWEVVLDRENAGVMHPAPAWAVTPNIQWSENKTRDRAFPYGNRHLNQVLSRVRMDGWFWTLDDDNIALPGFFPKLLLTIAKHPSALAIVFRQDVVPGKYRPAHRDHARPGKCDGTQVVARGSVCGEIRDEVASDGAWVQRVVLAAGENVVWVDEPGLLGYNLLRPGKGLGG